MKKVQNKKKGKLPVAIYIRYELNDENSWNMKETLLREYCDRKGYEVVKIYHDIEEAGCYYSETISKIIRYGRYENYRRLIVCDINEISKNLEMQATFFGIVSDYEIHLESLNDGIIGEDLLFGLTVHRNVNNREELLKNTYVPAEDTPF